MVTVGGCVINSRIFLKILCLQACLLLAACGAGDPPALRVGTNVWPGYEPLYLAQSQHYWKQDQVRLVPLPSASEVLRAFRNKSIEAAALTLDEALLLLEAGVPVEVILVTDVSHGGDVIVARPEIAKFSDLRRKRVAVESTALGAYVLTRALEKNGVALEEIEVVPLEVNAHEKAYKDGVVDAAVTFEPVRTKLLRAGAHEIFTSREMPGEIVDVLVVHKDMVQRQRQNIAVMIRGWFDALNYLQEQPQEAARAIAERLKISPSEALASFDGLKLPDRAANLAMIGTDSPQLAEVTAKLQATMLKQALLPRSVPTAGLFNAEFVRQASGQ
ncbi:MAG: ABC transporter substrate-binding protein [Pseudomonadota bacterium]